MGAARAFDFNSNKVESSNSANPYALQRATVFVSRMAVRTVLIRELKNFGIPEVNYFDGIAECINDLRKNPESMLVIDWEHGEQAVTKILRAAQGPNRVDTRPIYFLALDVAERVIAVANEYNVMQIHSGEVSQSQIVKNLNELLQFSSMSEICRKSFRSLASLRQAGKMEAAESILKSLCEAEPENIRAAVELGETLFEAGRFKEALAWMRHVYVFSHGDLRAQNLLARCLMKLGEFEEAHSLLEDAWLINPNNVDRLVDMGHILLSLDRVTDALGKFNEALQLDGDLKLAKAGKAQCHLLAGHVNEAIKLFGQIDSPQEIASVFNCAAILAIHQKRFKQGFSLYRSAVTYVVADKKLLARVFFNMGVGLVKWGKFSQALLAFEQAASLDSRFTKAAFNVDILRGSKTKVAKLAMLKPIQELESLAQEDEEFAGMDPPVASAAEHPPASAADDDDEKMADGYFQSLFDGS